MIQNWEYVKLNTSEALQREFKFNSFMEAIKFTTRVANIAEKIQHHPKIIIDYNLVTLVIWSHEENKVTKKCENLATRINRIFDIGIF
jgi:4a-hydroxytetrahydrobiopterin dehydratase